MCFQFGSLPDYRGGAVISALSPGDEIVIKRGFGTPPADGDAVETIVAVDGMSALTASGRVLACDDGYGVEATGNHFDEFEISPEAQKILDEIEARG